MFQRELRLAPRCLPQQCPEPLQSKPLHSSDTSNAPEVLPQTTQIPSCGKQARPSAVSPPLVFEEYVPGNSSEFKKPHGQNQNMHKPCPDHCAAGAFAPIWRIGGQPHRWRRYAQGMVGPKVFLPGSKATILHDAKKNRDRKRETQLAQVIAERSRDPSDWRGPTRHESWMGRRGNSGDQAKSPLRRKYLSPSAYLSAFAPCRMRGRHESVAD